MYKKILLAIDGSENAQRAADEAIKIARLSDDSEIDILFVIIPPKSAREILLESSVHEEEEALKIEKVMPIEAKMKANNIHYKSTILHGEAAPTIIEHERKHAYDLLVIGNRGLNAVQKFVLGSVSSKVIQKVDCPVLLIK